MTWCSDTKMSLSLPSQGNGGSEEEVGLLCYISISMNLTIFILLYYRGFESRQGLGIFLFTTTSRPALELIQPLIQWVIGALSLGVKRPGRGADHLPPSSVEVKNVCGAIPPLPQYAPMACCSIIVNFQFLLIQFSNFGDEPRTSSP
jgi:hypothetical protein